MKTDFPCVPCAGKKKIQSACFDCRETGTILCPLCEVKPETAPCALCGGAPGPECARCAASGRMTVTCFACRGSDKAACFECYGSGRRVCPGCDATGVERFKLVNTTTGSETNGGKTSHSACGGKGTIDCPDCQDRKAACWMARDRKNGHEHGKYRVECERCYGQGKVECGGCSRGSHRGLEIAAEVLRGAGKNAEAIPLLKEAMKRATRWFDAKKSADESAEDVEARVAARDAALARIRKAIDRLEIAAEKAPSTAGRD